MLAALVLFAVMILFLRFTHIMERRELARLGASLVRMAAPRCTIAEAQPDKWCAIAGRITTQSQLCNSALGQQCVVHQLQVQRCASSTQPVSYKTLYKRGEAIDFQLEDETGAIAVDAEGLILACRPTRADNWLTADHDTRERVELALNEIGESVYGDLGRRTAYRAAATAILSGEPQDPELALLTPSPAPDAITFEEIALAPGDAVLIVGRVRTPSGADPKLAIGAGNGRAYLFQRKS